MRFDSETITGEESLTKSLSVDVSFGVGIKDVASFKASTSYKKMTQDIYSYQSVYVSTMGVCSVYSAFFNVYEKSSVQF